MFDPSTLKLFVSRDLIFHEQVDEGNKDNNYESWYIFLKVEDYKEEA